MVNWKVIPTFPQTKLNSWQCSFIIETKGNMNIWM
jgi:hypothetical protein